MDPQPPSPDAPNAPRRIAVLPSGARFEGPVHLLGPGRIDGDVEGDVYSADPLWIGGSARVRARVIAPEIVVDGRVDGALHASRRVELRAGARVHAEIRAAKLVLEEGAVLEGRCNTRDESDAASGANSGPSSP